MCQLQLCCVLLWITATETHMMDLGCLCESGGQTLMLLRSRPVAKCAHVYWHVLETVVQLCPASCPLYARKM